jgi:hypothetical protein
MKNLNEHDNIINDINAEIDYLLEVDIFGYDTSMPWQYNLFDYLGNKISDIAGVGVDTVLFDRWGNPIAKVEKDEVELPDEELPDEELPDEETIQHRKEFDDEFDELKKRASSNRIETEKLIGSIPVAGMSAGLTDPNDLSNRLSYSEIKIKFRGNNEVSVIPGRGKEVKEYFGGTMDFDILTIKETNRGYIMNLKNRLMNRETSLLLYSKSLEGSMQTNMVQLTYKNGRYVGDPKKITFEVIRIR